jgi:hypothetical protein
LICICEPPASGAAAARLQRLRAIPEQEDGMKRQILGTQSLSRRDFMASAGLLGLGNACYASIITARSSP